MQNNFLKKINVRIAITFFTLSLILSGLLSYLMYNFTLNIIKSEEINRIKKSISQSSNEISEYLDKLKTFSDIIAMQPGIKEALKQSDSMALESLYSLILVASSSDDKINSISVISKEGLVISSSNDMAMPLSGDMMNEKWYKDALSSNAMPVLSTSSYITPTPNKLQSIYVCREIQDDEKNHLGIVLIEVSYDFIKEYMSVNDLGNDGYMYIKDKQDRLIYFPSGKTDKYTDTAYQSDIKHSDWTLYGIASLDNVNLLNSKLLSSLIIILMLSIGCCVIFALLTSFYLSKPIKELSMIMSRADETWEHISLNKNSPYEVSILANEYNNLIERIKSLTESIAKKEEHRRLFEINALQNQINPHFLYNTLDSILWLAELGENEAVVRVSSSLGKMLRVSLNKQTFIPLNAELEHVLSYLEIQKIRYEELLSYEIKNQSDSDKIYVPKLILQPLVENSIYHGIRGKKSKGHIFINCYQFNNYLFIEIEDNGVGFDSTKAVEPEQSDTMLYNSHGIGLKNVEQRIKLLCGNDFGLKIKSEIGKGCLITICLPINCRIS